jgi:hypothetical protein
MARVEWSGDIETEVQQMVQPRCLAAAELMVGVIEHATPRRGPFKTAAGTTSAAPTPKGARVNIGSPYWGLIEFGTRGSAPRGGVAKALAASGLRIIGGV